MNHIYIKILGLGLAAGMSLPASAQVLYNNGAELYVSSGGSLQVNGDMTNASGSTFTNNGTITLTGMLTNNQTMAAPSGGTLTFNGTGAQTLSGSGSYLAGNVVVNNPAGISLSSKLVISGNMTFTSGDIVAATTSAQVVFTSTGTHSGASNSSHVNGYVVKEGTGTFSYPVGDGTNLQKVDVNLSANGSGLQVKYDAGNAGSGTYTTTGTEATPLAIYNTLEYWDISPLSTATGAVTIYWDNVNNIVSATPSLRVAHKSATNWLNEGGLNMTGNAAAGSVTSNPLSTWSPFTLGATAASALPVRLLNFTAKTVPSGNLLEWTTVAEERQTSYSIERSADAKTYTSIGTVQGQGAQKNDYSFLDEQPLSPVAYYRLRITEPGSDANYSPVRMLRDEAKASWSISPVPSRDYLVIANSNMALNGQKAWISDLQGKVILSFKIDEQVRLTTDHLAAGMYIVHLPDGQRMKFIKE
ncbi:MAG: hypothetical protein BGO31_10545 [Bacteroidetes bacterium 43-16]|nr:MAG: hypothetical protein BGO31_10545 [Bacteroidetes bacterium 43-16]